MDQICSRDFTLNITEKSEDFRLWHIDIKYIESVTRSTNGEKEQKKGKKRWDKTKTKIKRGQILLINDNNNSYSLWRKHIIHIIEVSDIYVYNSM